jgi:hypothetical protein
MVHLPVLRHRSDLRIPSPCDEHFEDMTPEARGRRCAACDHVVHDMSAMTAREAARFLAERKGQRTCVHFELRPDGSIVYRRESTAPAPLLAVALAACTPHGPPPELERGVEVVEVAPALPSATVVPERSEPEPPPRLETAGILPCNPPAPQAAKPRPVKAKPHPTPGKQAPKRPKSELVIDGYME